MGKRNYHSEVDVGRQALPVIGLSSRRLIEEFNKNIEKVRDEISDYYNKSMISFSDPQRIRSLN